jgi:DNA topoisomerase VI subunit B
MSFASILSEPATDARNPVVSSVPKNPRKSSTSQRPCPAKVDNVKDSAQKSEASTIANYGTSDLAAGPFINTNGYTPAYAKPRKVLTARENEKVSKALALIDEFVFSDVETTSFDAEEERYIEKGKKRALQVSEAETRKRKVCKHMLHC